MRQRRQRGPASMSEGAVLSIASYWCLQIDAVGLHLTVVRKGSRDPAGSSSKEAVDNEWL